jgi:hypothetical protein
MDNSHEELLLKKSLYLEELKALTSTVLTRSLDKPTNERITSIQEDLKCIDRLLDCFRMASNVRHPANSSTLLNSSPIPAKLPEFRTSSELSCENINTFLEKFERKLIAAEIPPCRWRKILPTQCNDLIADWVDDYIPRDTSWEESKQQFIQHYSERSSEMMRVSHIFSLSISPKESVTSFMDRFIHMVKQQKVQNQKNFTSVLISKLPPYFQKEILKSSLHSEITELDQVVSLVTALECIDRRFSNVHTHTPQSTPPAPTVKNWAMKRSVAS